MIYIIKLNKRNFKLITFFQKSILIYYISIKTFKIYEIENRNFNINVEKDFLYTRSRVRKKN